MIRSLQILQFCLITRRIELEPVWFHFFSPKRAFSKKLSPDMRLVNSKRNFFIKVAFWTFRKPEDKTRNGNGPSAVHKSKRAQRVLLYYRCKHGKTEIPTHLSSLCALCPSSLISALPSHLTPPSVLSALLCLRKSHLCLFSFPFLLPLRLPLLLLSFFLSGSSSP